VNRSTPKRYSQRQLTEIFAHQANITSPTAELRQIIWVNPTDPDSLRLSLQGLQFVKANLKLASYEFELSKELTNQHLLQLERLFQGPYYLLRRKKIIVFEESEAVMLNLYGSDLGNYLDSLSVDQ